MLIYIIKKFLRDIDAEIKTQLNWKKNIITHK